MQDAGGERRRPEQRRRGNETKLRLALRAAQIGTWDWNIATGEMIYSARARSIFGFPPATPVTLDMVRAATHPDDRPRTAALAKRALDPELREKNCYEYRIHRADTGEPRWVLAFGEAIFGGGSVQRALRYIGTIQDITDRKRTEEALRESELRQRLAIEAAGMAVWELSVPDDRVAASPELNQLYALSPDDAPTIDELRRLYLPGERERVQAAAEASMERGERRFEVEYRARRADGEIRWFLLRAEVVMGPGGAPERVIGVLMDIDERKRSEERQTLLLREVSHRVKNSLSVVQALAAQTFRDEASAESLTAFRERLRALAGANDVLLERDWMSFSLAELVERIVSPYRHPLDRFYIEGEAVDMPPRLNVPLALVFQELCTNAAKYGALSRPQGRISISWRQTFEGLAIRWEEFGGPPVAEDLVPGFGSRLMTQVLAVEIGRVEMEARGSGLVCRILVAAPATMPDSASPAGTTTGGPRLP